MIKPDKNIPMPKKTAHANRKYPWMEMEIGDSFEPITQNKVSVAATATNGRKRYKPRDFRHGQDSNGKFRIWRIA